jgi:lipid-A-disaccharide synthase
MSDPLRLFVLAGEPSGDKIGADLLRRLKARTELELSGVGGTDMIAAGLTSLFPMSELAVMGWADVLPRLPKLLWRVRQVANAILNSRPEVVVLIDAQVFSNLVARRLHKAGYTRPVLLYVAPAVWGWKSERAAKIKPLYDEVLAVLPFEPAVMARLGGPPTTYVGHPAVAAIEARETVPERGPLLLLPGSREGELRRHLPLMRDLAVRFANHSRVDGLILPTLSAIEARVAREVGAWPTPVRVVSGAEARREAFRAAAAAVAVTGTITLEMALAGVPMSTVYIGDRGQKNLFLKYRPKFVALPNALLEEMLVPELLALEPDADAAAANLESVLTPEGTAKQMAGFARIRELMRAGLPGAPVVDPAERVLARAGR